MHAIAFLCDIASQTSPANTMKDNDKPKIGAPKKEETKMKISITLSAEELEKVKAFRASDQSISAVIGQIIQLFQTAEATVRPNRINRRGKPKNPPTDRG